MFRQVLDPLGSIPGDTLLALVPVAVLLVLLAVFRMPAWRAVIIGSAVTIILGILVWSTPVGATFASYGLGAATGVWSVDWIVFWGVVVYNTLVVTGAFGDFKGWLVRQATADIRVQTLLLAWSFGALMEGLVGFGYPWAVVAPILIALGVADLSAIRVAALANNAPVSFGALGAPIIGLAAVTGLPLFALSQSIGRIVAILALAPPWVLIYLVSGKKGIRTGWPLAIVGSFGYIAGQFPNAEFVGPYLPDITGALVSFVALFALLRVWRPKEVLGFGGHELTPEEVRRQEAGALSTGDGPGAMSAAGGPDEPAAAVAPGRVVRALVPFGILIVVVILWTGPWSPLPKYVPYQPTVQFIDSLAGTTGGASWKFAPAVAGTAILASWLLILAYLRPPRSAFKAVFAQTWQQMWGALLVGPFIFGLAYVFNYSGMANSMANGFAKVGTVYIILAPILGWIAVALSGSNTSSNAVFGHFQFTVGKILGAPVLLFPSLNSIGAEVGKPVAPQTASVGVATTKFVRNEGEVIRNNMSWTLIILVYLIAIGCLYYFVLPAAMRV
jgi:lactate permease